jgi:hypothetical protein
VEELNAPNVQRFLEPQRRRQSSALDDVARALRTDDRAMQLDGGTTTVRAPPSAAPGAPEPLPHRARRGASARDRRGNELTPEGASQ